MHREKGFFQSLTDFMSSGPVVAMVLEGEDAIQRTRKIMGATNPKEADPGTIRADFAKSIDANAVVVLRRGCCWQTADERCVGRTQNFFGFFA